MVTKIYGFFCDRFFLTHPLSQDMSEKGFKNHPDLEELAGMHNVIMSSHVAFYTDEAIRQISEKTLSNYEQCCAILIGIAAISVLKSKIFDIFGIVSILVSKEGS